MQTFRRVLVPAVLMLTLAACSNGGPAAFTYAGEWEGTIQDNYLGSGTISGDITQSGNALGGVWAAEFPSINSGGSVTGTVSTDGDTVEIELDPSDPLLCTYAVEATRTGNALTGTYSAINCPQTIDGTVEITKQP